MKRWGPAPLDSGRKWLLPGRRHNCIKGSSTKLGGEDPSRAAAKPSPGTSRSKCAECHLSVRLLEMLALYLDTLVSHAVDSTFGHGDCSGPIGGRRRTSRSEVGEPETELVVSGGARETRFASAPAVLQLRGGRRRPGAVPAAAPPVRGRCPHRRADPCPLARRSPIPRPPLPPSASADITCARLVQYAVPRFIFIFLKFF